LIFDYLAAVAVAVAVRVVVAYTPNPASVTLITNTTDNKNCPDIVRVNFSSMDANPAVTSYQLFGSGGVIGVRNSET